MLGVTLVTILSEGIVAGKTNGDPYRATDLLIGMVVIQFTTLY